MAINISNDYNIVSYEKFDEALKIINSLDSCDLVNTQGLIGKSAALPSTYSNISTGIQNIKEQIGKFANGEGPQKLIDNYKTGYNEIKNAIIDAYISEYEFALKNGAITIDAESLRELGIGGEEKVKTAFQVMLNSMSEKNKNLQYLNLTEFFKELESMTSKYSLIDNQEGYIDIFGNNVNFIEGYEDKTDVMPYTYLKPLNANGEAKPLIVWLHGGGARQVKTYSESNYNLTHVISQSDLANFDAYVISPVLTSSSDVWYEQDSVDKLSKLLDKFIAENNVDRNNIVICGGSAGGQGTLYMAKNMTDYFTQAVVLSGYGVHGINGQDIEIPIKGYVGKWDDSNSIKYMKRLASEIGEDKVTYVSEASHGKLPRILYNLDSDGDGKSDFIEDLFSNITSNQSSSQLNIKVNDETYEKLNSSISNLGSNLQPKNNSDIAHRGHSPGGVYDNSAEAFKIAGESGFWGCEADVRFDKNGELVCSHNAVKNGENPPSFEEYLQICKDYGMTAIIDLKYENGPNKFDENLSKNILETVEKMGMLDSCVLQTNNPTDVPYIRENSSDARIWYLTDEVTDSNLELIEQNNVECVNIKSTEKNAIRIKKLTENGVDVCVWNVQSERSKQSILNAGGKYVMSDYILGTTPYQEGEVDFNSLENSNTTNMPDTSKVTTESLTDKTNDLDSTSTTTKPSTQTPPGATSAPSTTTKPSTQTPPGATEAPSATTKPSTQTPSGDTVAPSATTKPSTQTTSGATEAPSATTKPSTQTTSGATEAPSATTKPSTQTPPGATVAPSATTKPSTQTPSGATTAPSTTTKPSTQTPSGSTAAPSTGTINISSENKLSHGLPSISEGTLGAMEISKSGVSYDVLNIDRNAYYEYLELLKKQGYVLNSNGIYTNGNHEVIITYAGSGSMNITLKILD